MMDGAGRFRIFLTIILPLSTPVITALSIFTFLGNWNAYLWPLISATTPDVYTIVIGLRKISQAWGFVEFYGRNMAAAVFTAIADYYLLLHFPTPHHQRHRHKQRHQVDRSCHRLIGYKSYS